MPPISPPSRPKASPGQQSGSTTSFLASGPLTNLITPRRLAFSLAPLAPPAPFPARWSRSAPRSASAHYLPLHCLGSCKALVLQTILIATAWNLHLRSDTELSPRQCPAPANRQKHIMHQISGGLLHRLFGEPEQHALAVAPARSDAWLLTASHVPIVSTRTFSVFSCQRNNERKRSSPSFPQESHLNQFHPQ